MSLLLECHRVCCLRVVRRENVLEVLHAQPRFQPGFAALTQSAAEILLKFPLQTRARCCKGCLPGNADTVLIMPKAKAPERSTMAAKSVKNCLGSQFRIDDYACTYSMTTFGPDH
jgi:hypothetical protein